MGLEQRFVPSVVQKIVRVAYVFLVIEILTDLESGGYYFIFLGGTNNGTVLGIFRGGPRPF
jgi:hypothetical protein